MSNAMRGQVPTDDSKTGATNSFQNDFSGEVREKTAEVMNVNTSPRKLD